MSKESKARTQSRYVTFKLTKKFVEETIDPIFSVGKFDTRAEIIKQAVRDFYDKNITEKKS